MGACQMRWPFVAVIVAMAPAPQAWAGDFAFCAQSVDAELKYAGCTQLIAHDPNLAAAYSSRGLALAAMGAPERAIADYSRAIELDPGLTVAYYNRGLTYLDIDATAAAADFDAVLARNPTDATAFNGRAMANAALGRFDAAEADFGRALAIDPDYVRAYVSRARLSLSRSLFDAARADFDRALQLKPGDEDALLGRTYAVERALPADLEASGSMTPMQELTRADAPRVSRPPGKLKSMALLKPAIKPPKSRPPELHEAASQKTGKPVLSRAATVAVPSQDERTCVGDFGEPCVVVKH